MDRVTIFGAGHVGATTAFYLALSASVELRMIDVEGGRASGLALDIGQSLSYTGSTSRVTGGSDSAAVEGSDLVIVTAGSPRQPGMSRADLTHKNASVVTSIAGEIARYAPEAVVIVVTNPVDEMTYLGWKAGGFSPRRIMGMAGVLDTSRFLFFLDRLGSLPASELKALVLGTHGDDMVPATDWSSYSDVALSEALEDEVLQECVDRTRRGGAEIVSLLRTGSAYFAPAVSIGVMALAIVGDTGRVLPASAYLQGEYGLEGLFLGVPASLDREGVAQVVEIPLSPSEEEALRMSAEGVRERISALEAGLPDEND